MKLANKLVSAVAEKCADFFNRISVDYTQIPKPLPPLQKMGPPEKYQISARMKAMKKPRSTVKGDRDVDPKVVTECADLLADPLSIIFKAVYETCHWPEDWKTETVCVIPKKTAPAELGETRNLSCTPLFSKLLESFVLEGLRESVPLTSTQFGGIKGLGVDHFLIETWDEILRHLDKQNTAVNLMSVDFQKAFNRMDHSVCIRRLQDRGAHPHLVGLVAAFLYERKMAVKIDGQFSSVRQVNGGAPQGSILGSYLFCITTEILAETLEVNTVEESENGQTVTTQELIVDSDQSMSEELNNSEASSTEEWAAVEREFNFFRPRKKNPLDDTVLSEWQQIPEDDDQDELPPLSIKAYIDDFNIIEAVRTKNAIRHCGTHRTKVLVRAGKCEAAFGQIDREAEKIKMVVNADKTQMLCISGPRHQSTLTYIRADGKEITSTTTLKILGFVFGESPSCNLQIEHLLSKFRSRLWSLRKLARSGLKIKDLLAFYSACLRPVLEYTSVTYHTMLSAQLSGKIEKAQARALKIIYGTHVSYREALKLSGLDKLEDRRQKAFEKFTMKCSNNARLKVKWFPLNLNELYNVRDRRIYMEEFAATDRLRNNPIFVMRRFLNELELLKL